MYISPYSTGVFAAITAGRGDDFSGLSIHGTPDPNFVFAKKDKGPQPFNPAHIFRRAFFARKYALGTTGFTVILRATGRICAIFNEIFALKFATAVSFSLDNHKREKHWQSESLPMNPSTLSLQKLPLPESFQESYWNPNGWCLTCSDELSGEPFSSSTGSSHDHYILSTTRN